LAHSFSEVFEFHDGVVPHVWIFGFCLPALDTVSAPEFHSLNPPRMIIAGLLIARLLFRPFVNFRLCFLRPMFRLAI